MKDTQDILELTQFDCYECTPVIKCNVIGCAVDYECPDCPDCMANVCNHPGKWCRPVQFSIMAADMIRTGQY